ncbi:TlpA family protein disulfide reductase [Aeromicrobium sp. CF4.19]|uniref:TlpA family protein disulfide reductase n=1 Tax=Aeromicrobium sp. CF4.19 TaxID=3373082 RepID=UPI003EE513D8
MRRAATALAAALLLVGCGAPSGGGTPTFGGGDASERDADLAALAAQAEDVGLRACPAGEPSGGAADDALPSVPLACLRTGERTDLASIEGPAVINLWASWCKPCREELPLLARLDEELGDEVQVVGIDVADGDPEAALELAERSGVRYPQLFDPDQLTKGPLRVAGLPQTVFVDEEGTMVATERVPYRSYADLTAAVERHLGARP